MSGSIQYINCIEIIDGKGNRDVQCVCDGHDTLYEAIACGDSEGMAFLYDAHRRLCQHLKVQTRKFIAKQTLEEVDT